MDRKQNVLIVHNYYQVPGGEDTVVSNEKKLLEENGHKVILYTRHNSELKQMSVFRKIFLPFTLIFSFRTYRDIKRIIKEKDIDIVHVHNTLTLISPSVYYSALSCSVPVVQTVHNFRLLCPGATFYRDGHICEDCLTKGLGCAVKHKCYRNSRLQTLACVVSTGIHRMTGIYGKVNYICLTDFNREKLLNLKSIDPKKVFVKPNFVENTIPFVLEENRKNQYVFAGRLDRLKGVDILFKAWNELGREALKLIICGTGPLEHWCKDYIERNACNIEMKGFIPNSEALEIIAESKALILPTQWYEGFPMSIVEAFSVGTPVLCSSIGNAGSVVIDGINGRKFECSSVEGLVDAIRSCNHLNESTLESYQALYSSQVNYTKLKEVYDTVST